MGPKLKLSLFALYRQTRYFAACSIEAIGWTSSQEAVLSISTKHEIFSFVFFIIYCRCHRAIMWKEMTSL